VINYLNSLTTLFLSDNTISNISFLNNLKALINLNLSNNEISDITILKEFTQLTHLNLENNQISTIDTLKELTKLVYLNLNKNQITDIRSLLALIQNDISINDTQLYNIGLKIEENPLEYPPLQTIKDGNKAIIRFFEKIDKEGTDTIFEAKVTLVGEGSAGKTSLLKRLLNSKEKLPEEKNRTRGISIADWEFKKLKNKRHIAHIWDFGGQDVYYPVHRFFLTENSVFVLLASSRQNTHHFDYWIPTIYQFGGKSPIILGQTCHDGNTTHWNDIGAYIANENFNIIKDHEQNYHEINLPNKNKGLQQIKKSIINQILSLPHYTKSVPKSWIPVRELINNIKENNCITYIDLKEKIKSSNPQSFVNKEDIEDCLRFFHSIGIILWYHKEIKLKNWVILNPKWSVDAVYKIIDDEKVSNQKGIIFSSDFERVWDETIYEDKHDILKDMLEVFKIAFPKKHNKSDYIMPTRLQSIPSESIWLDSESCLRIEYQYEFMPKGLVNQISAELSRYIIDDEQVWNNGVNFCDEETTCQVFEDFYHRKITIKAKGNDARSIIMIVMNAVKDITDGYKGVIPKIIIPCVCVKCLTKRDATTFSYEMLLEKIKEKAESKVSCNISEEIFKVEELLYNIGLPNPIKVIRDEIKEMEKIEKMKDEKNAPIKVFVTYSWADESGNFDEANQNKTGVFVNQLRTKWGLDASFDLHKQESNFVKMMYENLHKNDKIIIILTKGYAKKANTFDGGVGIEYERIINDIKQNPKKYILVSFEKRSDTIYPFGFQGSDVIVINDELVYDNLPDSQNRLLSKLTDEPLVEIPELNGKTPKVTKKIFQ
jgi:internalin A